MTFMEYFKPLIDTFNSLFNKKNEINTLFCICGETASGKDTLVNKIISMYKQQLSLLKPKQFIINKFLLK